METETFETETNKFGYVCFRFRSLLFVTLLPEHSVIVNTHFNFINNCS